MADPLQRYREKRDFTVTAEPQGGTAAGGALSFVVQKHAASRLHYDFRLECDGTLKSWAVPKGPSLDPADKRMAVQVEDHPLDYAGFEGTIPPGQYGAGEVIVWDRGEWQPAGDPSAGLEAGKLRFELHGEKLSGHWTLVRMRGRARNRQAPWLLIKERDDAARPAADYSVVDAAPQSVLSGATLADDKAGPPSRPASPERRAGRSKPVGGRAEAPKDEATATPAEVAAAGASPAPAVKRSRARPKPAPPQAPLPQTLAPQLATLVDALPTEGEWHYEIKFDGYRLLARIDAGEVRLFTRNGHDWTSKMRGLAKAVAALGIGSGWLDGEIVVQGPDGAPSFQWLQNAFDARRTDEMLFFVFDLPWLDDRDLRDAPLVERRRLLRERLAAAPAAATARVRFSEDFAVAPAELLHTACQMRMEGVIGKRADSPYVSRRASSWIKLKCTQRQEFVIGGYTDPQGSRVGLGALLLGVRDRAGDLRYAGNVGSGFDARRLRELAAQLEALKTERPAFVGLPRGTKAHWVEPTLVAEVSFGEWTKEGRIRHGVFHALRTDKPAAEIVEERPVSPEAAAAEPPPEPAAAPAPAPPAKPPALPSGVRLTHPERVIDAGTGVTKRELMEHYQRAAPLLLPHLKGRPVSLLRGPEGVGGELFFQKHAGRLRIPGIRLLDPSFDADHDPLLEVANLQALLGAVQMNVIEFHTWNATTRAIDQPDRMTFDLDPGDGLEWPRMREAAEVVRALLKELALESLLKTSGGKGLHVVVPFKPSLGWAAVKGLSQAVVLHLAATLPDRFVAKSGGKNRVGKIFVDYLRNGRGATTAAAWSVRARPGLGVSVPVGWEELPALTGGAHWSLRTVGERLAMDDPWRAGAAAAARQTLKTAMRVLDYTPPAGRSVGAA